MICTKRAKNIYLLILIIVQSVSSCSVTSISTERKNKEITISSLQAKGYNITNHLQPRQFEGHNDEELQRVCIEGNDTIPSWCFSMIPTLTGVTLSNQVSIVEDNAFYACKQLKHINLDNIVRCGENSFKMTALDTVNLKKCKYVDDFAFSNCEKLKTVNFSSSLKKIGVFSFYADSSLIAIEIPTGEIGNSCFMGCGNLKEVALDKVTRLGEASFMGCSALVDVRLSKGIKIIEPMTFQDCASLNSIVLTEGVEYIAENAFQGTGLTKVTIPSSVKEIKSQAFANCIFLKTVTICNKNTVVSHDAFDKNVIIEYKNK